MTQLTPRKRRPSSMLQSLQQEVNDLFGDFFGTWDDEAGGLSRMWAPRMDVSETDGEYRIKVDLPGVSRDDVEISAENHRLTIRGERKEETREEGENLLRVERARGSFYRSIPLPDAADIDQAKAEFSDGTLTVRVAKSEKHKPKKIAIS